MNSPRNFSSRSVLIAVLSISIVGTSPVNAQQSSDRPLYKNPSVPVEQRVEDLLGRMTLEEKIAQITTVWADKNKLMDSNGRFDPAAARRLHPAGIGHFARPQDRQGVGSPYKTPFRDERETVELTNAIQRYATQNTRLGIPVLFHEEGLHGYAARGATHFPQAIALASSWDPALLERVFTVVAREIRARGAHLVLAPVVDVARDPRWGRTEETYGEDPYLVGELGVAAVRGYQGTSIPLAKDRVFATLKHMTGHGQPESGTNVGPANISERILREVFFPPFHAAIERGNAQAVMPSYNEIDGLPSHANRWLLQEILRGEMKFKGVVTSDYFAIKELIDVHSTTTDPVLAAVRALKAGVDADLPNGESYPLLVDALKKGLITQQEIDTSVRRMLRLKFDAGLFEQSLADAKYAEQITDNAEARALALEAARKSIVLLKNDGLLPLKTPIRKLAVIGPNAARADMGGYSNVPTRAISVLDGLRTRAGKNIEIVTAEGVRLTEQGDWHEDDVVFADPQQNRVRIKEAVAVARDADAIVLVIGGSSVIYREAWAKNHLGDRPDLGLFGEQEELAAEMFALGKPVAVVLINGQPLSIPTIAEKANAVVEGWYLGQEGGTAMAEVLFGDTNPGGKLPITIARSVGHLPAFYNYKPSARRGYLGESTAPLFPFGFGLSYTTFDVGAPRLSANRIGADSTVKVSVDVRNTGAVRGDEVVQIYVRDVASSVTRPVKELKAFRRVTLEPGASTTVEFTLDKKAFAFWNEDMQYVVEPGAFEIMSGPDSVKLKSTTLEITSASATG